MHPDTPNPIQIQRPSFRLRPQSLNLHDQTLRPIPGARQSSASTNLRVYESTKLRIYEATNLRIHESAKNIVGNIVGNMVGPTPILYGSGIGLQSGLPKTSHSRPEALSFFTPWCGFTLFTLLGPTPILHGSGIGLQSGSARLGSARLGSVFGSVFGSARLGSVFGSVFGSARLAVNHC